MTDFVLIWLAMFGVWPFDEPEHWARETMSVVDAVAHFGAIAWLFHRWEWVGLRRRPRRSGISQFERTSAEWEAKKEP